MKQGAQNRRDLLVQMAAEQAMQGPPRIWLCQAAGCAPFRPQAREGGAVQRLGGSFRVLR